MSVVDQVLYLAQLKGLTKADAKKECFIGSKNLKCKIGGRKNWRIK